jgi:RNA polymerase sigma-70 factor (ECF subfamily)
MVRLARSIVGAARAEEVVQEAWIKVLAALPTFELRSSLRVWLMRILRNEAISLLRKDRRSPETETDDALDDRFAPDGSWRTPPAIWSLDTPEALLASKEMQDVLNRALEALPELQRTVLTLKDIEDLSFDEICNVLEISASNARVLLHRARRRLWAAVDIHQTEEHAELPTDFRAGKRLSER